MITDLLFDPVDSYFCEGSHSIIIGGSKSVLDFLAEVISDTCWPESIQVSLRLLTGVVTDDKIALDFFHVGQSGICIIVNTSCCSALMRWDKWKG